MLTITLSMMLFAFIGAVSPGPVNVIATSAGASFGFRGALPHVLGSTIAYTLIVLLVGLGLNELFSQNPFITQVLKYLGTAFLLYMAYQIATAQPTNLSAQTQEQKPSFLAGALAQWLNPKAWLVSMSGISVFVTANSPSLLYLMIFCIVSFCMCFTGVGTWAALGHLIRHYLSNQSRQIYLNRLMGVLLSMTVVMMWLN